MRIASAHPRQRRRRRCGRLTASACLGSIAKLKPSWPAPRTDREDPYAIRAALLLGVVAAALAAGGNLSDRLRAAFTPAATSAPALLRLDAWVTPPVYTGIAPIVLADGSEKVGAGAESFRALSVPERSELIVRTHAPQGETVSLTTSRDGTAEAKMVAPKKGGSEGLVEFNVALTEPLSAAVEIGGQTVSKWRFELIEDTAPTINLMGSPTTTPRGALRLVFRADDDNGVASAEARFALGEGEERNLAPLPAEAVRQGRGRSAARASGHAAAIAAHQRQAGRRPRHPGSQRPPLGRTESAHDAHRPRPGRAVGRERAL